MSKRKMLIERVYENTVNIESQKITKGCMGDKSCRWIEIKKGDYIISITFDYKGNTIEDVEVHKEIHAVVDQQKIC